MAELNLKQITDKLNVEFAGETRKLIFWYDDKAEFDEDIDTLELIGAKVYKLEQDNQFYTKHFLERQDTTNSYLIYAPFPKPPLRENHLEDTLRYSKQFFADRASLLTIDLGIDEKYKPVVQKYIKFFGAKERTQKFYDLEMLSYTEESIEIALMSVLCKTRTASFDEVLRVVVMEDHFENNKYLAEFEKYDLLEAFWRLSSDQFGYSDPSPTIEKLVMSLYVTHMSKAVHGDMPSAWKNYMSFKAGNIIAFIDNLMNSILYRERYDELSTDIFNALGGVNTFGSYRPEAMVDSDTFEVVDRILIEWIRDRLIHEDMGAKLGGYDMPSLCNYRIKKHFGSKYKGFYKMMESAYVLIGAVKYATSSDVSSIMKKYIEEDILFDASYRRFYSEYDKLLDASAFEDLRDIVENIYSNCYLSRLLPEWSKSYSDLSNFGSLPQQKKFFDNHVKSSKDRTVVIISDALRYEVGEELHQRLLDDAKCNSKISHMISVLPSYTRLGMAALLPNKSLQMTEDYKVLLDGLPCDDLKQREVILRSQVPNSRCIQFDDLKSMKQAGLREVFTGMDVVYVYHNQIDARGDKLNTENEVFDASNEAIDEIYTLIKRLSGTANTQHFIITADHGFLYKRDKLNESDKIVGVAAKGTFINRRFIIADEAIKEDGVYNTRLGLVLRNEDQRMISYPAGSNVFKVQGGGQNFVHGGASPQEMIIPVVDVKVEKGQVETRAVQINLVSMIQKITNLITSLDFIQTEPISDAVKATNYRVFFVDDLGEKISNECLYVADRKDDEPGKRIFRLKFNFKNKQYDKTKKYYLVAYDEKNALEVIRHELQMDLAFADDFGFNV